jgi:putative transposon-encoded protein
MKNTLQTHSKISGSTNVIAEKKKYNDMITAMKAEGTYCDSVYPERSFKKFGSSSCVDCPNYEKCRDKSENESMEILKYRRKNKSVKPKSKRCKCK